MYVNGITRVNDTVVKMPRAENVLARQDRVASDAASFTDADLSTRSIEPAVFKPRRMRSEKPQHRFDLGAREELRLS